MAMGMKLKRAFAGKFVVMSSDADDAEQVFGPASRAECQAWAEEREGSPQHAAAPAPGEAPSRERERAWAKHVDDSLRAPLDEEEAELRAVLEKRRKEDEVEYLIRTMRPHLKAGIEGARRERGRAMRMTRQVQG